VHGFYLFLSFFLCFCFHSLIVFTVDLVGCQSSARQHAARGCPKLQNVLQSLFCFCIFNPPPPLFFCCGRAKVTPILYRFLSRNIVQGYNPAASDWQAQLRMMKPAELPPAQELDTFIKCVSMPVSHVTRTKIVTLNILSGMQ
jgi:hypothetical protein